MIIVVVYKFNVNSNVTFPFQSEITVSKYYLNIHVAKCHTYITIDVIPVNRGILISLRVVKSGIIVLILLYNESKIDLSLEDWQIDPLEEYFSKIFTDSALAYIFIAGVYLNVS
jgi:hypothetical protein